MAERDWGAEAGPLADLLEENADDQRRECWAMHGRRTYLDAPDDYLPSADCCPLALAYHRLLSAAEGLRLLARLTAVIGDPDELRCAEHTCSCPASFEMLCSIADAVARVSAEAGEEPT